MNEYRPQLIPRRGEIVAWSAGIALSIAWAALTLVGYPFPLALSILAVLLLLSAIAISLGNWVDRRTLLRLGQEGVHFENGLRKIDLHWDQIEKIQIYPSEWGNKVYVLGNRQYFSFRTLGEVVLRNQVKGRMGFAEGDAIVQAILKTAGLERVEASRLGEYYQRK